VEGGDDVSDDAPHWRRRLFLLFPGEVGLCVLLFPGEVGLCVVFRVVQRVALGRSSSCGRQMGRRCSSVETVFAAIARRMESRLVSRRAADV